MVDELNRRAESEYISPAPRFSVSFGLGDRQEMYRWLSACVDDHTAPTTLLCVPGPAIYDLRDELRFATLLRQLQLPGAAAHRR